MTSERLPTAADFESRVRAFADDTGRLSLPDQAWWDIFPFEPDSLVVKPLDPLMLPEPPRSGEGGADCARCADPEAGAVWSNDHWTLVAFDEPRLPLSVMVMPRAHLDLGDLDDAMAGELGVISARVARAVEALDVIGRMHVYKIGDGGAHLHQFLLARPAGMLQLRGSCLTLWEEMLPVVPADESAAVLQVAVGALAGLGESRL
jgi:diadenosine tetraphosphate (Ap4A) HIT family hydrolase